MSSNLVYNGPTREQWLMSAVEKIKYTVFVEDIVPENVRVSVGLCDEAIGLCCNKEMSEDDHYEIFIDPSIDDPVRVLDIIVHELIHAINHYNGDGLRHNAKFYELCAKVGLISPGEPRSATVAGDELKKKLEGIASELGDYPHKKWVRATRMRIINEDEQFVKYHCPEGKEDDEHFEMKLKRKYTRNLDWQTQWLCPKCGKALVEVPPDE